MMANKESEVMAQKLLKKLSVLLYEGDEEILDMLEAKKQEARTTLSGAAVLCLQNELNRTKTEEK